MTDITATLSRFVAGVDTLPAEVVDRAKLLLLDLAGIAVRARFEADSTPALLRSVERLGLAAGTASVFGDEGGFAPPAAALVNGTLAHSLDFDDTHARGSIHPSAPIVPAALAAGEMTGAAGADVIAGIVAGYEVQIRLSLALVPKDHYDRGFHPTATCGAFGAAAAAARVFGLSADAVARAFGLCGSQAAGSMQFLADGAWNKRFHTGYAAMNGLIAAVAAAQGYKGAADAIEGEAGFLRAYAPNPVFAHATAGLGEVYETLAIAVKPYPSCRYSHAPLDALIALRAEHGIDADEVESVEIGLSRTGRKLIGVPEPAKQRPQNVVDGQFSMPFVGAVALREGRMSWDDYAPHLADAATLALCRRIRTVEDPRAEAEFPANMSAVVRLKLKGGRSLQKLVVNPKGEPDNFMTEQELRGKFDSLVEPYLGAERTRTLADALLEVDGAADIGAILALSRPDAGSALRAAADG